MIVYIALNHGYKALMTPLKTVVKSIITNFTFLILTDIIHRTGHHCTQLLAQARTNVARSFWKLVLKSTCKIDM